jgi:hypothetical protein
MKIKLSQNDIYDVIDKVAKNHRNKSFSCYTTDDIEQQVWVIALEKLDEFDQSRCKESNVKKALEHWLNTVISNRLSNFYRDKYLVLCKISKHLNNNINSPLSLDSKMVKLNNGLIDLEILKNESWEIILSSLDDIYNDILESILSGETVSSYYKIKLFNKIKFIWDEKCQNDQH